MEKKKSKSFKDLPIRIKLLISHALIAILAFALAICGLVGINRVTDKVNVMYHGPLVSSDSIGDLMYATTDLQRAVTRIFMEGTNKNYAEFEENMNTNVALITEAAQNLYIGLEATGATQCKEKLEHIGTLIESSDEMRKEIAEYISTNRFVGAKTIYENDYRPILNEIKTLSKEVNNELRDIAYQYYEYSVNLSTFLTILGICMIIISLVSIAVITRQITNTIAIPVRQITEASEAMNQGDLSKADVITYQASDELGVLAHSIHDSILTLHSYVSEISDTLQVMATGDLTKPGDEITDFRGEFASIKQSLLYILKRFNSTLTEIHDAADQVNTGSDQISSGSQALAQGAAEQASSVEELSATIYDISAEVNKTAGNATTAQQTVDETGAKVQTCNEQMGHMMTAMEDISQKSAEISKIVKTIEDIAFQTNILALNAAVEAARAGSAGKGFAVVADEVRNLASKSAEASKNTSDLIGGTVTAVQTGTKILGETAQTLETVVEGTAQISALVSEIAKAANHEATALQQVSDGIDQISKVVQTTSATAEESAAASEELSGQANLLEELVGKFVLHQQTKPIVSSYASPSAETYSSFDKY